MAGIPFRLFFGGMGHERKPPCDPLLGCQANRARRGCTFRKGWDGFERIVEVCIPKHGLRCQSMPGGQNGVPECDWTVCPTLAIQSHHWGSAPFLPKSTRATCAIQPNQFWLEPSWCHSYGEGSSWLAMRHAPQCPAYLRPTHTLHPIPPFLGPFLSLRRLAIVVTRCDCLAVSSWCLAARPSNRPFLHSLANVGGCSQGLPSQGHAPSMA